MSFLSVPKKYKKLRYQKNHGSNTREFYKLSDKKKRMGIG